MGWGWHQSAVAQDCGTEMTHGVPHMHNVPYAYTYVVLKMHEHKLALFQLWQFYSYTYNKPEAPTGVLRSSPFTLIRSGIDISFP